MNCKNCRHWFVNPNIVVSGEPTEGKCLVSEIKTQSNQVCNAWEHSQIADWKDENEKLTARIAELEEEIDMPKQLSQPIEFWSDEKNTNIQEQRKPYYEVWI